jgi:hypothetical protein
MKRFLTVIALCVMTFWGSHDLKAGDFGIVGGASFTGIKNISPELTTGYHAGLTYKFHLPYGFAIQPSLLYHMKSSLVEEAVADLATFDYKMGYLELPVSFQWGPDLLLFRPFLDVSPFVGYALNNEFTATSPAAERLSAGFANKWDGVNRLEYGLGLGGGLEIWKVQVVCRYNWNFGQLFDTSDKAAATADFIRNAKESVFNDKNFGGVTLSVALLF